MSLAVSVFAGYVSCLDLACVLLHPLTEYVPACLGTACLGSSIYTVTFQSALRIRRKFIFLFIAHRQITFNRQKVKGPQFYF